MITGKYPNLRLRRSRKYAWSRKLVQESSLSYSDLILPIFLIEGKNKKESIKSMPNVFRYSVDKLNTVVSKAIRKGIPMISLAINNEFGDNTINSSNTYQGGGSTFQTSTDVEELSATLGLGYSLNSDGASVEFAYEADANDDKYLSHYGSLKIVGRF